MKMDKYQFALKEALDAVDYFTNDNYWNVDVDKRKWLDAEVMVHAAKVLHMLKQVENLDK